MSNCPKRFPASCNWCMASQLQGQELQQAKQKWWMGVSYTVEDTKEREPSVKELGGLSQRVIISGDATAWCNGLQWSAKFGVKNSQGALITWKTVHFWAIFAAVVDILVDERPGPVGSIAILTFAKKCTFLAVVNSSHSSEQDSHTFKIYRHWVLTTCNKGSEKWNNLKFQGFGRLWQDVPESMKEQQWMDPSASRRPVKV